MSNTDFDFDSAVNWGAVEAPANNAAISGFNSNPDAAAKAIKLSKAVNVPAPIVEQAPEQFELQKKTADATQALEGQKELQQYAQSGPMAPKVSQDDWWNLRALGDKVKALLPNSITSAGHEDYFEGLKRLERQEGSFATQRQKGGLEYERGSAGSKVMALDAMGKPIETPLEQRIQSLDKQLGDYPEPKGIAQNLGNMVGNLLGSWDATVAGGLAGSAVPGLGTGSGALYGFALDQGRVAAGNQYLRGKQQGLDTTTNVITSTLYGAVVGALNTVGGGTAAAPVKATAVSLLDRAMGKVIASNSAMASLGRAFGEVAKQGAIGGTLMGAQQVAQETATEINKWVTSAKTGEEISRIMNDPKERDQAVDRVADAFISGALLLGAIHLPVAGVNLIADRIHINQSKINGRTLDEVMKSRDDTLTYQRSPELINDFMKQYNLSDFQLDPNVALEIHKSQPNAFAFIPDFERKAQEAQQSGGLLSINPADYLEHVGPDLHGQIKDDLSINGGLSVNEATLLEEMPPKYTSVFHGSPYLFDRFDLSKVGTGEGAQAYGYGHYFTEDQGIAEGYRDNVTESRASEGVLTVNGERHNPNWNRDWTPRETAIDEIREFADGDFSPENWEATRQEVLDRYERSHHGAANEEVAAREKAIMEELRNLKGAKVEYGTPELFPTLYRANITAHPDSFLHWDESVQKQTPQVQKALEQLVTKLAADHPEFAEGIRKALVGEEGHVDPNNPFAGATLAPMTGEEIVNRLEKLIGPKETRQRLMEAGLNGVKYRAAGHRRINANGKLESKGPNGEIIEEDPLHNFVVFNDDHIEITHRNGEEYPPPPPPEITKAEGPVGEHAQEVYGDLVGQLTERANAEARAAGLNGLFADAKAAGMTKPEFVLYQRRLAEAQKAQEDKIFKAAAKEAKKRLTPEWKANRARIREEVVDDVNREPEMAALRYLQEGETPEGPTISVKLDKKAVDEMLGPYAGNRADYPSELPRGITEKDGVHPDDMAPLFGFDSGIEMLQKLGAMQAEKEASGETWTQRYKRKIEEETDRRMEAQYGNLDENIAQEARDAALNSAQFNLLSAELEMLQRISGMDMPFTKEEIKAQARTLFNERLLGKETRRDQWIKNAGAQARRAEMMLLRQKYPEAFLAKQRQMLALHIADLAKELERDRARFEKMTKPFIKNETLTNVAQRYTDQIQRMLNEDFGIPTRRDMNELHRGNPPDIKEFVDQEAQEGRQLDYPNFLNDTDWLQRNDKQIDNLRVKDFRELRDFVKQLVHNGKDAETIQIGDQTVALNQARQDAIKSAGELARAWNIDRDTVMGKTAHAGKYWDALLIRPDRLLQWLGKRDLNSPWTQIMARPFQEAKGVYGDLQTSVAKALKGIDKVKGYLDAVPDSPLRTSLGDVVPAKRRELLSAVLNMGNEGNFQAFARGYFVTTDELAQWVHQHATKDMFEYAQGMWDMFEQEMFPHLDRVTREMTGVGLLKVEPKEIQTQFGKYRGGYYPLIEEFNSIDRRIKDYDFGKGPLPPVPTANWMKRRTGASYPVSLNPELVSNKIGEMMHYIAYAKPWRDASKFFDSPAMRKAVDNAFGLEYRKMMQSWLNDIASGARSKESSGLDTLMDWSAMLRQNTVATMLGARPGTAAIHGLVALSNSMTEAGVMPFMKGSYDALFGSTESGDRWIKFAYENSGELRYRKRNLDRDIGAALEASVGKSQVRLMYLSFATSLVAKLDQMSATPTWIAGYQKFAKENFGKFDSNELHSRAVYAADQLVKNAHGSSGFVDLPQIMRTGGNTGELMAWFTMYGGTFNHYYNQLRDRERAVGESIRAFKTGEFKEGSALAMKVMGGIVGYVLANSLIHHIIRQPDEEDGILDPKTIAFSVADQFAAMIPIGRDVWYAARHGFRGVSDISLSPMGTALSGILKPLQDAKEYSKNKVPAHWVSNLMSAPMFATGIGAPTYVADMAQYLLNHAEGKVRLPYNNREWIRLLMDAKAPPKKPSRKH